MGGKRTPGIDGKVLRIWLDDWSNGRFTMALADCCSSAAGDHRVVVQHNGDHGPWEAYYRPHELSPAIADQEQPPLHIRKRGDAGKELRQLQLERDLARGHQANAEARSRQLQNRVDELTADSEVLQLRAALADANGDLAEILDALTGGEIAEGETVPQIAWRVNEDVLQLRARVEELKQGRAAVKARATTALRTLRAAFRLRAGCDLVTDAAEDAAAEAGALRARVEELDRRLCQLAHLDDLATAEEAVEQIAARCQLYDRLADPEAYDCADPETLASQAVRALRRATEAQSELTGLRHTLVEIAGLPMTEEHDPADVLERLRYLVAALEPLWEPDRGLLSQAQESLEQIGRWRELDAEETRDALRGLGGTGDSSPHHTAARLAEVCELLLQIDRAAHDSSPVRWCRPGARRGEPDPLHELQRRLLECLTLEQLTRLAGGLRALVGHDAGLGTAGHVLADYLEHLAGEAS
jgi:hypothetical protein